MKSKKFKSPLLIIFTVIYMCGLMIPASAQNVTPKVLKAISNKTEIDKFRKVVNAYIDDVKMESNGQLIIEIVADRTSVPNDQQIFTLIDGVVDISFDLETLSQITPLYTTQKITKMLPWEDREAGLYDFWREAYAKEANIYWLGRSSQTQWFIIGLKNKINNLEGLKKLKIRCNSPNAPAIEALGAVPVIMPSSDIIPAMQRGVIDGFFMTPEDWTDVGYQEVTNYVINVRFIEGGETGILVNMDTWNSLTTQEKNWLQETLNKNEEKYYALSYYNFASGQDKIPKVGVEMINFSNEEIEEAINLARIGIWNFIKSNIKPEYAEKFVELMKDKDIK